MTPIQYLTTALMAVPARARLVLYVAFAAVGALLGVLFLLDVSAVFGIGLGRWERAYAYLAPVFGITAAVNVRRPTEDKPERVPGKVIRRKRKANKPGKGAPVRRVPRDLDPNERDSRFNK